MNRYASPQQVADYQRDGAVYLPGLFKDWVEAISAGIERNMREPGPYASENLRAGDTGRFFDDYCNWERIPEFQGVVRRSPAAETAAELMGSGSAQFFHDHVLVKEPGTSKATPWHQDAPYYFVEGEQTVSFWIPVDPVSQATLRCIAGSHLWPKLVMPVRWLSDQNFYPGDNNYLPVPDPDAEPDKFPVLEHGTWRACQYVGASAPRLFDQVGWRRRALCHATGPHLPTLSGPRHARRAAIARGLVSDHLAVHLTTRYSTHWLKLGVAVLVFLSSTGYVVAEVPRMPIVRIAELQIDPAQLEHFKVAVKEEMDISVRQEPGVLAIYAVAEKDNPSRLRFFEMYADEAAYKSHIQSPHFRKYFETTKAMIMLRRLIETDPVQLSAKQN
jgi:quinol monooxygenase YgiN